MRDETRLTRTGLPVPPLQQNSSSSCYSFSCSQSHLTPSATGASKQPTPRDQNPSTCSSSSHLFLLVHLAHHFPLAHHHLFLLLGNQTMLVSCIISATRESRQPKLYGPHNQQRFAFHDKPKDPLFFTNQCCLSHARTTSLTIAKE